MLWFLFIFLCISCGEQPKQNPNQALVLKELEILEKKREELEKIHADLEREKELEESDNLVYIDEKSFSAPPPPPPPPPKHNMSDKIKRDLQEAHSKTDCMLDYLRKKESGDVNKTYEEYCE